MIVYYNGKYLKEDEVCISPFSRALHYGDGVFETMRSYAGRIFRLEDHLSRLLNGLGVLRIKADLNVPEIHSAIEGVLQKSSLSDASVKIIAFRQGGEGPAPPPDSGASVLISARPFDYKRKEQYEKGISAQVVSIRRNNYSPVALIKSLNYLDNILGRLEARDNKADEALFLNINDKVAEGATSNIFMVKGGIIKTPPDHAGILKGITRQAVLQIAEEDGIALSEIDFSVEELLSADEVFLTNSLMEIMPLVSVNKKDIGKGLTGDMTGKLMEEYSSLVKKELNL